MAGLTALAGPANSALVSNNIQHQSWPLVGNIDPQNGTENLELDFAPDNPNFTRARDDETVYWSSIYKELSHPKLFTRAARTRERLIPDLKKTLYKLSTSKRRRLLNGGRLFYDLEPPDKRFELRLTGNADASITKRILMTGWVWIQCSDRYSIRKIKKRLDELTWLKCHAWAPVYVHLNPIIAARLDSKLETILYDSRPGISLGGGFQLHIDIARFEQSDSLCGCPCRSRITFQSEVLDESFCRIGGALLINDSVDVLITTGHSMLNFFVVHVLPLIQERDGNKNQPDDSDGSSDESSDENEMGNLSSQELPGDIGPDSSQTNALGYIDTSQLQQWEPLRPFDTITYIAQARQTNTDTMWNLLFRDFDADYALFRLSEQPHSSLSLALNNVYVPNPRNFNSESDRPAAIENHNVASLPESETSYILLNTQDIIPVHIFPDDVIISIRGVTFKTLKLRAPKIIAQGTSGSWVVRGDKLCGVIIAIYHFEPYALMLPATTVSQNLREFGARVESVSLRPTAYSPLISGMGDTQLGRRIISAFETSTAFPHETSLFPQSEPHRIASMKHGYSTVDEKDPLRTYRLTTCLKEPDLDDVIARLMTGRTRDPKWTLTFLHEFKSKFSNSHYS